MKKNTFIIAVFSIATLGSSVQSCATLAGTSIGLAIVKNVLLGGINKGLGIFSDKDSFLGNQLISQAMPKALKDFNSGLEKVGLGSLVTKEKAYIAQAAAFTVNISRPILEDTVNKLTTEDAKNIVQGGSGVATQILKERSSAQLVAAISPVVDNKLNEYGVVKMFNTALANTPMIGTLLGSQNTMASGMLSRFASEQLVNGLFNIIQDHENQNFSKIKTAVQAQ